MVSLHEKNLKKYSVFNFSCLRLHSSKTTITCLPIRYCWQYNSKWNWGIIKPFVLLCSEEKSEKKAETEQGDTKTTVSPEQDIHVFFLIDCGLLTSSHIKSSSAHFCNWVQQPSSSVDEIQQYDLVHIDFYIV